MMSVDEQSPTLPESGKSRLITSIHCERRVSDSAGSIVEVHVVAAWGRFEEELSLENDVIPWIGVLEEFL
jgi:hypothetical protein